MTVQELIELLQTMSQDAIVYFSGVEEVTDVLPDEENNKVYIE